MPVVVIDTIKPKNNLTFPIVEDVDILIKASSKRLSEVVATMATQDQITALQTAINGKASQLDLTTLSNTVDDKQNALSTAQLTAVNSGITSELVTQIGTNTAAIAGKADASDVATADANLQAQIDNLVTPVTQDAEVQNARVGADSTSYNTLKSRLDAEFTTHTNAENAIKADINTISENTGSQTVTETLTITWTLGYMATNGSIESSDSYHYSNAISVKEGDIISSNYTFRFVTAFNSSNQAVPEKGISSGSPSSYTVPSGITKVVVTESIHTSTIQKTSVIDIISAKDITARNSIDNIANIIDAEEITYQKAYEPELTWTMGYMATNGTIDGSNDMHYSNYISVKEGDVIATNYSFRFVTAFDSNRQAVPEKGVSGGSPTSYTVPSGISYVVVTEYLHNSTITILSLTTEYVLKGSPFGLCRASGNMASGDSFYLPYQNINKKTVMAFSGEITSFSKIEIGRGAGSGNGYYLEIDDTNITIHKNSEASEPIPHGLTITNDIQVKITDNTNGKADPRNYYKSTFRLTSNGESFETSDDFWLNYLIGNPFVKSVGSALHDCAFTFQSLDANKSIYAFGDSYFSWYDSRWAYYMASDGYADNILTNAFAGQGTLTAVTALGNVIKFGKPKYILWCLGMNDGSDSSETYSAAWKQGIDTVISLCIEYGITPILATIPTVPTINHEKKNAWIRSSGYRYVDFAKAVGAASDGTWYSGMLGDGIHPSETGAKALYNRLLADVPEIVIE